MFFMIKNIWKMFDRTDRKTMGLYSALSMVAPIVDLVSVSAILPILQQMTNGTVSRTMLAVIIGLGCLILAKGILDLLRNRVSTRFIYNTSKKISLKVFDQHIREDMYKHNERTAASMLTAVRNDCVSCVGVEISAVSVVVQGFTWCGLAAVLIYVTGFIGIISCFVLLLFMVIMYLGNRVRMKRFGEKKRTLEIRLNAIITAAYGAYKELKINTKSGNMLKRYDIASEEYTDLQREYSFFSTLIHVIMTNTIQAAIYFILAIVVILEININEYMVVIIAYVTILIKMIPQTSAVVNSLNSIKYAEKPYRELMVNISEYQDIVKHEEEVAALRKCSVHLEKGLKVQNLCFGYPNGPVIFDDAEVELPAHHTIAIVGNSGIGKTSFLDLILGILKPDSGHIFYDDYDIVDGCDSTGVCYGDLGEIVSYIPQVVYMNGDSVKNNVLFMTDPESAQDEKVISCLKCAQVWEDVKRMPEGMDTVIGANGTNISGGQRQRIALARALYRDFEVLVMDEATAALDTDTERAVIDSIRQMKDGKTLIMVTHHMSLAEECEYIYKIENKKIVRVR